MIVVPLSLTAAGAAHTPSANTEAVPLKASRTTVLRRSVTNLCVGLAQPPHHATSIGAVPLQKTRLVALVVGNGLAPSRFHGRPTCSVVALVQGIAHLETCLPRNVKVWWPVAQGACIARPEPLYAHVILLRPEQLVWKGH
eukprot:3010232-Prymnesium_polylepis.3